MNPDNLREIHDQLMAASHAIGVDHIPMDESINSIRMRMLARINERAQLERKVELVKQRNNQDWDPDAAGPSQWKNGFAPIPEIPEIPPPLERKIKV